MRDLLSRIGRIAVGLCLLGAVTFAGACGGGEEGAVDEAPPAVDEANQATDDEGGDPPPFF